MQDERNTMSMKTSPAAVLAVAIAAIVLSGCTGSPPPAASPGDAPAGDAPVSSGHGAGECFQGGFEYVDCADPHDSEIVSTFSGFDLNTTEGLDGADAQCGDDTNAFLGVDALPAEYRYGITDDGGTILCYVGLKDGSLTTGSLAAG
jgi:hypothetical protein